MVKHTFLTTLVAIVAAAELGAAPPVRTMYNDALAKEQAVRMALTAADANENVLKAVRETVATYEAVVKRYPASGYSDNALWQAARLSADAYRRFHQAADRDAAARLMKKLAAAYPSSKLVRQIPDQVAQMDATTAAAATQPVAEAAPERPDAPPPARSPVAAPAPSAGAVATIKAVRRAVLPDAVRVIIELDNEVAFHEERISDPSRVFIDFSGTRPAGSLVDQTMRFESDADIVRQVRIGRHPNNVTRVVLDANGVSSYSVYPLYEPYRLVIDCVRDTAVNTSTALLPRSRPSPVDAKPAKPISPPAAKRETAPLRARSAAPPIMRTMPSLAPQHGVLIAEAHVPVIDAPAVATMPVAKATESLVRTPAPSGAPMSMPAPPPVRNGTGGLSIARQLGLGVSRIVIDPGHGGHDSGAKGRGVVESELVLDISLRLEKLLQRVPGVEVILTRRTDDYIELPDRTALANREGADLFLSIHANASASAVAHGIETYYLNFATNLSAAAVAARENANSTQAMGALPDFVKAIALNTKVDESHDFATHVQNAMVEHLRPANKTLKDLGVKQAPFVVLIGAVMPSVLAEISFVTNPQEARLLKSNAYRQRIAEALFDAVRKYQSSLRSATTVATQR